MVCRPSTRVVRLDVLRVWDDVSVVGTAVDRHQEVGCGAQAAEHMDDAILAADRQHPAYGRPTVAA